MHEKIEEKAQFQAPAALFLQEQNTVTAGNASV
jgi:hypothetical protein